MTIVAGNKIVKAQNAGARQRGIPNTNERLYAGTCAFRNSAAPIGSLTGTSSTNTFAGVVVSEVDNLTTPAADVSLQYSKGAQCEVYQDGVFWFPMAGVTAAANGSKAYCLDNYTFGTVSTSSVLIGRIVEVDVANALIAVAIDVEQLP